jgi:hypothetical protein
MFKFPPPADLAGLKPRPFQKSSGLITGMFAVFQYLYPIYKNVVDASCILMWLCKRGIVFHCGRIKHNNIGKVACLQLSSFLNFKICCR